MTMLPAFASGGESGRTASARERPRSAARWVVACLALLLLAQVLGLAHGVVHLRAGGGAFAAHEAGPQGLEHAHEASSGHEEVALTLLASAFGAHEDGDPSCQVFDAAGHHAVWLSAPMAVVGLPGRLLLRATQGAFVARWAALYDARGPPASA